MAKLQLLDQTVGAPGCWHPRLIVGTFLCHRGVGGEAIVWQVPGGTPDYKWERDCLSHRSLRHHVARVWHARGGRRNAHMHT